MTAFTIIFAACVYVAIGAVEDTQLHANGPEVVGALGMGLANVGAYEAAGWN